MNIEDYQDVFEPFDKLVRVKICGERREVPENNTLLRCFQYFFAGSRFIRRPVLERRLSELSRLDLKTACVRKPSFRTA
jgi:hypothetical protein